MAAHTMHAWPMLFFLTILLELLLFLLLPFFVMWETSIFYFILVLFIFVSHLCFYIFGPKSLLLY